MSRFQSFGFFQKRDDLLTRDSGKSVKELVDSLPPPPNTQ